MDWRKIPFPERKALLECVSSAGAEVSVSGGCFRLFFPGEHGAQIKAAVLGSRLDEIFAKGEVLRHSSQSYRIVTSVKTRLEGIPGEIFIKKVVRKSWEYGAHYLFRYAGSIRGVIAAERMCRSGVDIPPHLYIEEKRKGPFLKFEYVVTDYLPNLRTLNQVLENENDPESKLNDMIPALAEMMGKMHTTGVTHRDFNFDNIYLRTDEQGNDHYGLCDFLDAKVYGGEIPERYISNEFWEVLKSIYAVLSRKGILPVPCCKRFYEEYLRWKKAHGFRQADHRRTMDEVMNKLKLNFQK
ncbi:MAG: hypothetical protein J5672_06515 [Verrucomicrobia bacterium]|nr:hypothetical protein [Verrucomicrobiota bacterium]